jgi:hypothetical protein
MLARLYVPWRWTKPRWYVLDAPAAVAPMSRMAAIVAARMGNLRLASPGRCWDRRGEGASPVYVREHRAAIPDDLPVPVLVPVEGRKSSKAIEMGSNRLAT